MSHTYSNIRPPNDPLLETIADYVLNYPVTSHEALQTARYCVMDSLACGMMALRYPDCTKMLGPIVPGTVVPNGTRVPGTPYILDPVKGAFDIGCLIRWLDFNDTWLAAEWGHPSDNLGAILAVCDFLSQQAVAAGKAPLTMRRVLEAAVKAHEIQGVLALENSFNRVGLDHVLLVRIASTAVSAWLMGANREQTINAISNAWLDGGALRTYRHAPNTGSRKSWAAGDATSRAVRHAMIALTGEMGYPSALSAPKWGFCDVLFKGQPIKLPRTLGSYVMEHVLFKISFPAEFHAQTAVEAAFKLHPLVKDKIADIEKVTVRTHESAVRIIDKTGPLHNPADRDHCLQYMIAVGMIFGNLTSDHYLDPTARDSRIDTLRDKMGVQEEPRYTKDYLDPEKRSIANALQVFFKDGTHTPEVEVEYPVGHRFRRTEGIPLLIEKFKGSLEGRLPVKNAERLLSLCQNGALFEATTVNEFMGEWFIPNFS